MLTMRGSFLKFAKGQLRRKFGKGEEGVTQEASIMDRLQHQWVLYAGMCGNKDPCLEAQQRVICSSRPIPV